MSGDPFAPLTRQARWRARLLNLRRCLLRPLRPDRIVPRREGPPNLLLMGVDTLRADHVGCLGSGLATTPHLDRNAVAGTTFTDVMAPAPWTLPSFASALTGLMPGLHGGYLGAAVRNMDRQPPRRLDPEVVTLAGHLAGQGYRTAAFYSNQFFAFGLAESFQHHAYHNLAAADLARVALEWMRRHADRPFFCFVLFNDPHEPTTPRPGDLEPFLPADAPAADLGLLARWGEPPLPDLGRAQPDAAGLERVLRLKRSIYAGTVHEVDGAIGLMQRQLEDWELAPRTLCSVFADHGEEFHDHAAEAARWGHDPRGLLGIGHGHTQFQELLHVPWLSWGPGVPAGRRETCPVSLCDLGPTLADWLGVAPLPVAGSAPGRRATASGLPLIGRSLAASGGGSQEEDRVLLAEALAFGPDLVALRRGRWKLIAHRDGRPLGLYDLAEDPVEARDRQAVAEAARQELLAVLERWRACGLGATDDQAGSWQDLDDTVRRRLKDLGYSE